MRRRRWIARRVGLFLILVLADYALYPVLSRPGGISGNRGENGLWLRYRWYFGQRSDADLRTLARRLREQQIRYAYFHVRHVTRNGAYGTADVFPALCPLSAQYSPTSCHHGPTDT